MQQGNIRFGRGGLCSMAWIVWVVLEVSGISVSLCVSFWRSLLVRYLVLK